MIIKTRVEHKSTLIDYSKYLFKVFYYALPSIKFTPTEYKSSFYFIVGCGHSGTTLLASKLSNHPDILGIGRETGVMQVGNNSLYSIRSILNEWDYFAEYENKKAVLEKTPKHVYSYQRIQRVAPNSKVIVMIRNPLDTIASLYKRFGDVEFSIDRWIYDNEEALKLKNKDNVLFVKYEDFTRSPESEINRILDFLELNHSSDVLGLTESVFNRTMQEGNMKLRQEQVNKPIKPNEGGWVKVFSEDEAKKIIDRVKPLAARLDYKL